MMPEKADEREEEETNLTNRKAEDVPRCPFSGRMHNLVAQ